MKDTRGLITFLAQLSAENVLLPISSTRSILFRCGPLIGPSATFSPTGEKGFSRSRAEQKRDNVYGRLATNFSRAILLLVGRVGNERKRVSGEGGWNTDRASSRPPRRLVPRLRPSQGAQGEGEVHNAIDGAIAAPDQTKVFCDCNHQRKSNVRK